jgi:poly-gamma-glutamate capsule biosynthesis protein CapA/YwtB (metallophosphatase superfamily)
VGALYKIFKKTSRVTDIKLQYTKYMESKTGKIILFSFSLIMLVFIGSFLIKPKVIDVKVSLAQVYQEKEEAPVPKNETEVIFVGDIMLDRGVKYQILKQGGNWQWPFLKVADEFKKADLVFGNLEGPISDKGTKAGSIYSFRDDPRVISGLTLAGFDVLSVANNHAFDYTREAIEDTFLRLKEAGIDYVGGGLNATEAATPIVTEVDGVKFGFLAYTNLCPLSWRANKEKAGVNCVSSADIEKIKKEIAQAKKQAEIVIVSVHAGEEYSQELNWFQVEFSKAAIDAGADIVIGHHPHVVQKYEIYKNKYIFYSLGNFVFDQSFSTSTMEGLMVKMIISEGKIKDVTSTAIKINSEFQPEIK